MPDTLANASNSASAEESVPSPFSDVIAGNIPAITLPPIDREHNKTYPAGEYAATSLDKLVAAGLDYEETADAHSVFFNPKLISGEQIQQAFKAGKLLQIAPLVRDIKPTTPAAAPAAAPLAQASAPAAAAGPLAGATAAVPTDRKLQTARLRNSAAAKPDTPNSLGSQVAKRAV